MPEKKYLALFAAISFVFIPSRAPASDRTPVAVCDAKDFGARGDGQSKDTSAIQAAIDRCAAQNGGVVRLRDGVFLSGMIQLKSGIELRIEPSATLKGTRDDRDYPAVHPPSDNTQLGDARKALIYAESAKHVAIDGGGTIDGSGDNPRWIGKERTRPMAIFIASSSDLAIEDISVKNSGMWSVVPFETDDVVVRRLHVESTAHPNRDGIDIVDCHHVLIEDSTIFSDDDAICLKSGSRRGVYDVTVRNNRIMHTGANGLKLGSASVGFFEKILFENIDLDEVGAAAMAVESVDGGKIRDLRFHDIHFKSASSGIFVILGGRFPLYRSGSIENVSFDGIDGAATQSWGSSISGTHRFFKTDTIKNISLTGVHIRHLAGAASIPGDPSEYRGQYPDPYIWGDLPAYGYYFRHVDGITMRNSSDERAPNDPRPEIVQSDVHDFKIINQ